MIILIVIFAVITVVAVAGIFGTGAIGIALYMFSGKSKPICTDEYLEDGACYPYSESTCPPGQQLVPGTKTSDSSCETCPPNTFSNKKDDQPCQEFSKTSCAGEQFIKGNARQDSKCIPHSISACPLGKQLVPGTNTSDSSCETCPPNTFSDKKDDQPCQEFSKTSCAGEQFIKGNARQDSKCIPCPANTFSGTLGICNEMSISKCSPGEEFIPGNATKDASCIPCPDGTFNATGKGKCSKFTESCRPGHELVPGNKKKDNSCKPCDTGTFLNEITGLCQSHTDRFCPPGSQVVSGSLTADSSCEPCPAGTFSLFNDNSACINHSTIQCSDGESLEPGTVKQDAQCVICDKDTFIDSNDGLCKPLSTMSCPPGEQFVTGDANNDNKCEPCPDGTFSDKTDKLKCNPHSLKNCQRQHGTIAGTATSNTKCEKCKKGFFSDTNDSSTCKKHTVDSCTHGSEVIPGTFDADSYCKDCKDGFFKGYGDTNCKPFTVNMCPPGKGFKAGDKTVDNKCVDCLISNNEYSDSNSKEKCQFWDHQLSCDAGFGFHQGTNTKDNTCIKCINNTYSKGGKSSCKSYSITSASCGTHQEYFKGTSMTDDAECRNIQCKTKVVLGECTFSPSSTLGGSQTSTTSIDRKGENCPTTGTTAIDCTPTLSQSLCDKKLDNIENTSNFPKIDTDGFYDGTDKGCINGIEFCNSLEEMKTNELMKCPEYALSKSEAEQKKGFRRIIYDNNKFLNEMWLNQCSKLDTGDKNKYVLKETNCFPNPNDDNTWRKSNICKFKTSQQRIPMKATKVFGILNWKEADKTTHRSCGNGAFEMRFGTVGEGQYDENNNLIDSNKLINDLDISTKMHLLDFGSDLTKHCDTIEHVPVDLPKCPTPKDSLGDLRPDNKTIEFEKIKEWTIKASPTKPFKLVEEISNFMKKDKTYQSGRADILYLRLNNTVHNPTPQEPWISLYFQTKYEHSGENLYLFRRSENTWSSPDLKYRLKYMNNSGNYELFMIKKDQTIPSNLTITINNKELNQNIYNTIHRTRAKFETWNTDSKYSSIKIHVLTPKKLGNNGKSMSINDSCKSINGKAGYKWELRNESYCYIEDVHLNHSTGDKVNVNISNQYKLRSSEQLNRNYTPLENRVESVEDKNILKDFDEGKIRDEHQIITLFDKTIFGDIFKASQPENNEENYAVPKIKYFGSAHYLLDFERSIMILPGCHLLLDQHNFTSKITRDYLRLDSYHKLPGWLNLEVIPYKNKNIITFNDGKSLRYGDTYLVEARYKVDKIEEKSVIADLNYGSRTFLTVGKYSGISLVVFVTLNARALRNNSSKDDKTTALFNKCNSFTENGPLDRKTLRFTPGYKMKDYYLKIIPSDGTSKNGQFVGINDTFRFEHKHGQIGTRTTSYNYLNYYHAEASNSMNNPNGGVNKILDDYGNRIHNWDTTLSFGGFVYSKDGMLHPIKDHGTTIRDEIRISRPVFHDQPLPIRYKSLIKHQRKIINPKTKNYYRDDDQLVKTFSVDVLYKSYLKGTVPDPNPVGRVAPVRLVFHKVDCP